MTSTELPNGCGPNEGNPSDARHSRTRANRTGHVLADRYELTRKIGEGGMGEVYEAKHQTLGRRVAVKLLHDSLPQRDSYLARFSREAATLASLSSEHIVAVTDFDKTEDGIPFMVMEYLEGEDLRRLLKRYSILPVQRAVQLVADACEGVKVAHARGLVHRDIKPENLFVCCRPSGTECCKVLDFGVAKQSDASTLTRDGALIGTVRYMAPEQALGKKDIDGRVDVFALGSILYECLCGEPAFDGDRPETILFAIIHRQPTPLSDLNPEIPPGLEQIVARALARDPADRYATIYEFADALAAFLQRTRSACPEPEPQPLPTRAAASAGDATLAGTVDSSVSHLAPVTAEGAAGKTLLWSRVGFVGAVVASACLGAAATAATLSGWSRDYDPQTVSESVATAPATTPARSDSSGIAVDAPVSEPEPAAPVSEPAVPSLAVATQVDAAVARHAPRQELVKAPPAAPRAPPDRRQAAPPARPNTELSLDMAPNPYR